MSERLTFRDIILGSMIGCALYHLIDSIIRALLGVG